MVRIKIQDLRGIRMKKQHASANQRILLAEATETRLFAEAIRVHYKLILK